MRGKAEGPVTILRASACQDTVQHEVCPSHPSSALHASQAPASMYAEIQALASVCVGVSHFPYRPQYIPWVVDCFWRRGVCGRNENSSKLSKHGAALTFHERMDSEMPKWISNVCHYPHEHSVV